MYVVFIDHAEDTPPHKNDELWQILIKASYTSYLVETIGILYTKNEIYILLEVESKKKNR
jgi:hypothetical protein